MNQQFSLVTSNPYPTLAAATAEIQSRIQSFLQSNPSVRISDQSISVTIDTTGQFIVVLSMIHHQ